MTLLIKDTLRYDRGVFNSTLGLKTGVMVPLNLLKVIVNSNIGDVVTNPTSHGKDEIKVTRLIKQRASIVLSMKYNRYVLPL